jgi:hypothetical protein
MGCKQSKENNDVIETTSGSQPASAPRSSELVIHSLNAPVPTSIKEENAPTTTEPIQEEDEAEQVEATATAEAEQVEATATAEAEPKTETEAEQTQQLQPEEEEKQQEETSEVTEATKEETPVTTEEESTKEQEHVEQVLEEMTATVEAEEDNQQSSVEEQVTIKEDQVEQLLVEEEEVENNQEVLNLVLEEKDEKKVVESSTTTQEIKALEPISDETPEENLKEEDINTVPSSEKKNESNNNQDVEPNIKFIITGVTFEKGIAMYNIESSGVKKVKIQKRYNDFKRLHADLAKILSSSNKQQQEQLDETELPTLPRGSSVGNLLRGRSNKSLLAHRQQKFENFLNTIAVNALAYESDAFQAFIA